jgi:nitroimidazol reductase NimA-like FMN-containing flavoprotein (pyridoxamine 5'-phosphate oxidase superfamily)
MLGTLEDKEIEDLLKDNATGRIGCHADGVTYIVPVNYLYDSGSIFAHSTEGMKIEMMRKNHQVCFQIDEIVDLNNWKSVICWGDFEEIKNAREAGRIMQQLSNQVVGRLTNKNSNPSHGFMENEYDVLEKTLIIYRIRLSKKTGRFEVR